MKRPLFAFCLCLLSLWATAQITCEVRVDAHPHATTRQRVNYCLTPQENTDSDNPGLVFSGVTSRYPATETVQKPSAHAGHFNQGKITVERTFVDTQQFPQFRNATRSEQELRAARRVPISTPQKASFTQRKFLEEVKETQSGLRARKTKPARRSRVVLVENSVTTKDVAALASQEIVPMATEYTYEDVHTQGDASSAPEVQEYVPTVQKTQEYAPVVQDVQEYVPAESVAQPYVPVEQNQVAEKSAS